MKKVKSMSEKEFLSLLLKVLPQETKDSKLADAIYNRISREVQLRNHVQSFENFCQEGSIPDTEPTTVEELKNQLATNFTEANIEIIPEEDGKAVAVEIQLPEQVLSNKVRIIPADQLEEEEAKVPMVPFPVSLPEDPENVWFLARREDFAATEAARSLSSIEEEFWATKAGYKVLKDAGERTFADFIANVPAAALAESGMKRVYKTPETITVLRLIPAAATEQNARVDDLGEVAEDAV